MYVCMMYVCIYIYMNVAGDPGSITIYVRLSEMELFQELPEHMEWESAQTHVYIYICVYVLLYVFICIYAHPITMLNNYVELH